MMGKMLSHYRLVEKIGEGGMGVVWRAEDTVLGRTVAIKVLPADVALDEERRQLFLNEARLAASLSHAHIVQVHDLGREGDLDFIVMEYVEGQPLDRLLRGHALPPEKVASLGLQIAEGLSRAHHKQLLHRDLKPANVLVTPEGEVKIVDFGLATLFEGLESTLTASTVPLTDAMASNDRPMAVVGTLPYMSPEQVRGEKLDARSDIFSFGTVLYEMTTGRRPFQGNTAAEIAQAILGGQPTPVQDLTPKVPLDLLRIIEKTLARKPEDRYQHMEDVTVDLRRLVKEIESGTWPSYADTQHPVVPKVSRRWLRIAIPVLVLLAAAGAWTARERWGPGRGQPVTSAAPIHGGTPNYILVAEFEAPGVDSSLAEAVRDLVITALQQSNLVTPISRLQLQQGLELAGKPPGTRVAGEVARELAYRATAGRGTYVEGRMHRVLSGHSIVLDVIKAEDGHVLISESGVADNEELLIPTVDRLCKELRKGLGERNEEVRTGQLTEIMTPSFEAYRLYFQANRLQAGLAGTPTMRILRQALVLDPDFASAWSMRGTEYSNGGFPDSARIMWDEALRRPERMTEVSRLGLKCTMVLFVQHDPAEALRLTDLGISQFPQSVRFHRTRTLTLMGLGRFEEANDECVRVAHLLPFGPTQVDLGNQFECLIPLGRYAEARQVATGLEGSRKQRAELTLRLACATWASAESLATDVEMDPAAGVTDRFMAQVAGASLPVIRGEIDTSARALDGLLDSTPNPFWAYTLCLARLHLWVASGKTGERPDRAACIDTTTAGLIVGGIRAAALGDVAIARRTLTTIETRSTPDRRQYAVETNLLEAWIAASEGEWDRVVRLLEPSTMRGQGPDLTGRLPIRWLAADAEEKLGHLDAAASGFEQVLSPLRVASHWMGQEECVRAIYWPFAHQRLVLLYARLGRADLAEQHWKILQESFTHPDPCLAPLVEQARKAIQKLKIAS
jgi:eukaryotic-like serine/threonine-protein kinase